MKSRRMICLLISVVLCHLIIGCTTKITKEYVGKHSSIRTVINNMTQENAIAIVNRFCVAGVKFKQSWIFTGGRCYWEPKIVGQDVWPVLGP